MEAVNLERTKLFKYCEEELDASKKIELNLAQIHGDFNLGNILEDQNENVNFVDFENSEYFFSIYDLALLHAYAENFQIRNPSYEYFIKRFVNYLVIHSGRDAVHSMNQAHQKNNNNRRALVYIACLSKLMIDLKCNLAHDHATSIKLTSHIDHYA
jgi:thiamine kinase-like enzyme